MPQRPAEDASGARATEPCRPRVLAVDDDPSLRVLMRRWLTHFGCEVVTAADGIEALARLREQPFDAMVTDLRMPGIDGLQLLAMARELDPNLAVVFLSGEGTMDDVIAALRFNRAFDFLRKPLQDFEELGDVVRRAIQARPAARPAAVDLPAHVEPLSAREREILALVVQALDNAAIGDRLGVSPKTVKNSLTRIYEKLKVENRAQAIVLIQQLGRLP